MSKKSGNKDKTVKNHKKQSMTRKLIFGSIISLDFIQKHWISIFVLVLLVLIYISTKYKCQTDMEIINKLTNHLEVIKTERIHQRSTYMSRIRESAMQELVDSLHPGLVVQEQPPFHLPSKEK